MIALLNVEVFFLYKHYRFCYYYYYILFIIIIIIIIRIIILYMLNDLNSDYNHQYHVVIKALNVAFIVVQFIVLYSVAIV